MNTINVFEQPLPGLGRRFDLDLDGQHTLSVVVLRDGRRQVIRSVTGDDTPIAITDLDREQAATIGALLLGAQFSNDATSGPDHSDRVVVDTIAVAHCAPAVGKTPSQAFDDCDHDAVVLAVIRDHTPELVERDPQLELGEGDRVAFAVRHSNHHRIAHALTGH
jgi:TrkA domain protein